MLPQCCSLLKSAPGNNENWDKNQVDKELEYLEEVEQQKEAVLEDLETIAAHQQLLWQMEEEGRVLEARMHSLVEEAENLNNESQNVRQLFKIFNVVREDFEPFHPDANQELTTDQRKRKLVQTGERILSGLDGYEPAPADTGALHAAGGIPTTNQRKRRRAAEANTLIYAAKDEEDAPPANDPPVRTPAEAGSYERVANRSNIPVLTPRQHPQEALIAAAAFTYKGGDAASALLILLQTAYAAHVEAVTLRAAAGAGQIVASQPIEV